MSAVYPELSNLIPKTSSSFEMLGDHPDKAGKTLYESQSIFHGHTMN